MKNSKAIYALKLVFPIVVMGTLTGAITGAGVTLYRFIAHEVIGISKGAYALIQQKPYLLLALLPCLLAFAFLLGYIYKKTPTLKGGGISGAMGLVGGFFTFKWLGSLVGTVLLSLSNFLIAVPLGNEGPSVQIGASIGKAASALLGKRGEVWSRYSIAGGACSGFAAATGAPMTGVIFAVEEMHRRLSPMILLMSIVSVAACRLATELLCPVFGLSVGLFPSLSLPALDTAKLWMPLCVGLVIGAFSLGFLYAFRAISRLCSDTLGRVKDGYKIFAVFAATVALGLCSYSFVSTGHELVTELLAPGSFTLMLMLLLLVRSFLTLSANATGLTGGMFLPTLAVAATASSLLAHGLIALGAIGGEYYTLIVVLGVVAGMSGTMSMPFTAILFSLEALGCAGNLLAVFAATGVSYLLAVLFRAESINELALEKRLETERRGKTPVDAEYDVVIQRDAFAIGKEVRDIFWPAGLFVRSVTPAAHSSSHAHGLLQEGDTLRVCYRSYDDEATRRELFAIVGKQ